MSRRSTGSITQKRPGVWRVVVSVGRDPITGKRARMVRTVEGTKRQAERELAGMLVDAGSPGAARSSLTVETYLLGHYLPSLQVRRRTADGYESKIRVHVLPYLGRVKLSALTAYDVARWQQKLEQAGVGAHTRRHAYRVLRQALRRAMKLGLVTHDVGEAVDPPRLPDRELEVLDVQTFNAYLDAFAGHELEALVVLAGATGMRRSELAGLTWSDVDLDEATVRVERGKHETAGGHVWIEPPKSKRSRRTIDLPSWAVEALRPLRGVGEITALSPLEITRAYRQHVEACGLPYVPLRDLRHTHATLLLEAGAPLDVVSRRLGHSGTAITDQVYVRTHREYVRQAVPFAEVIRLEDARKKQAAE